MDVREKLFTLFQDCNNPSWKWFPNNAEMMKLIDYLIDYGVTVQEWISVKDRKPTEADGTVFVCLADVFPYNEKEPYIDAKHDRRITEANYSQFSNKWYKDGAVFADSVVTHWMEKPQPPKGE